MNESDRQHYTALPETAGRLHQHTMNHHAFRLLCALIVFNSAGADFLNADFTGKEVESHAGSQVQRRESVLVLHSYRGPLLLDLLRAKLADQRFRVVLTSDNSAFDFAHVHRAELFPGVPIVFMGLNGYQDSMLRGESGITGVAENTDLHGTLQVLLQLMPQTKRIVFPGMADDITYRAIRTTVAKDLHALPPGVETEFPDYPDVDSALDALRTLPPDSSIVIMTNMRMRDGEGIGSQRVVELVSAAAPVPVFTSWDFVVGHGALGGSVISGVEHGRQAAQIAVLGFSQLMKSDPDVSAKQKESLDIINRSGEYLLNLINNVLDISKIESGRLHWGLRWRPWPGTSSTAACCD